MAYEKRVRDARELDGIINVVHDYWFDVDDVSFDESRRRLVIKFQRPTVASRDTPPRLLARSRPLSDWVLEIEEVDGCHLEESEGVGKYDFNEILYSGADRSLTITTGIPLAFRMDVESLDITVRELG